jgi:hypothetical protein
MKIAVLLAGQARTFDEPHVLFCMNTFFASLGNPDIFISTWNTRGYSYSHGEGASSKKSDDPITKDILLSCYKNVKDIHIDDETSWFQNLTPSLQDIYKTGFDWRGIHQIGSVVPQYYMIKKANDLKRKYEKENNIIYDLVIRTRFDNLHGCPLNPLDLVDLTKAYTLNHPPHYYPDRIYDVFFYTNSKNMDTFCEGYSELEDLIQFPLTHFDNGLHPRDANRIFYIQFRKNGIDVVDLDYVVCEIFR